MESSDDSFAWTGASSDSADSPARAVRKENKYKEELDTDFKKELKKYLFHENDQSDLCNEELDKKMKRKKMKEERGGGGAGRVKTEPESDSAGRSLGRRSPDDGYLRLRVKLERATPAPPTPPAPSPAQSRNRRKDIRDAQTEIVHVEQESVLDTTHHKKSKKRKGNEDVTMNGENSEMEYAQDVKQESSYSESPRDKKRKSRHSDVHENDIKDMIVEDMFSAEETVVETRHRTPSHTETTSTRSNSTGHRDDKPKQKHSNLSEHNSKQSRKSVKDSSYNYSSKEFVSEDSSSDSSPTTKSTSIKKRRRSSVDAPAVQESPRSSTSEDQNVRSAAKLSESIKKRRRSSVDAPAVQESPRSSTSEDQNERSAAKLSERLRFEEDDAAVERRVVGAGGAPSASLARLLRRHPRLRAAAAPPDGAGGALHSRDDDLWLLTCPREVEISSLKGRDLVLDTRCKLKVDGFTCEGTMQVENGRVAILSLEHSTSVVRNVPLSGTIHFRKRIPKAHLREDNFIENDQNNFIPLPHTKCRHPLFGSDYRRRIKIPSSVRARLVASEQELPERGKRRARPPSAPPVAAGSRRKRKLTAADGGGDGDAAHAQPPKRAKRHRREPAAEDAWESEQAIQEKLFNY